MDLNKAPIVAWTEPDQSKLLLYEPRLDAMVGRCRGRNLYFSTVVEHVIKTAEIVSLSVNTPTKTRYMVAGQASDLRMIEA